ncbi:hypothetical protein DM02DRAFT_409802 [Periconia macrospinosa]|uniref:Uncharacterized protein n=1 Tax=Periconia macrospinosa TaxID=97972 RepID=A0A2V1DQ18_9PLEO|nr:hypothetical protein DM02DRAFT_409802 [Periconia macrospinosa]
MVNGNHQSLSTESVSTYTKKKPPPINLKYFKPSKQVSTYTQTPKSNVIQSKHKHKPKKSSFHSRPPPSPIGTPLAFPFPPKHMSTRLHSSFCPPPVTTHPPPRPAIAAFASSDISQSPIQQPHLTRPPRVRACARAFAFASLWFGRWVGRQNRTEPSILPISKKLSSNGYFPTRDIVDHCFGSGARSHPRMRMRMRARARGLDYGI